VSDVVDALILDLLEWIGPAPRPSDEVMEVWRTSCPRLPVWEDAVDRGYVTRRHVRGQAAQIAVTPAGADYLRRQRAVVPA
jgi:D-3-phosphoglycerate dehydrogenase